MLKVENLVVKYGLAEALHGICLEVPAGKIVTVLGANGAGKTTLLRSISGLQPPSQGSSILFEGKELSTMKAHSIVSQGLAHVPEGRQVFSSLSVEDNLRMGAFSRKDKAEISSNMEKMFDLFPRLKERVDQTAGTLSGGEQQMLAIARAMMSSPKFLMLDEPSMGLAPVIVEKIYDNIMDINNKLGMTILLVEQNANIALEVSDYAYTLINGNIGTAGYPKDLLADDAFSRAFLGG